MHFNGTRRYGSLCSTVCLQEEWWIVFLPWRYEPTQQGLTAICVTPLLAALGGRDLLRKGLAYAHRHADSHKWFCVCLCIWTSVKFKPKFQKSSRIHVRIGSYCFNFVNTDQTSVSCFEMIFRNALTSLSYQSFTLQGRLWGGMCCLLCKCGTWPLLYHIWRQMDLWANCSIQSCVLCPLVLIYVVSLFLILFLYSSRAILWCAPCTWERVQKAAWK